MFGCTFTYGGILSIQSAAFYITFYTLCFCSFALKVTKFLAVVWELLRAQVWRQGLDSPDQMTRLWSGDPDNNNSVMT